MRAFYTGWYKELVTVMPVIENGFVLPMQGPGLGTELSAAWLARPELIRQTSSQGKSSLSGYAVGNPYREGNPWERR